MDDPVKLTILVADDDRDFADTLTMLVKMCGHDAKTAYDGKAALDLTAGAGFHGAFLDLGMPKLDGYQLAEMIRKISPGTKLIAVSGHAADEHKERAADAGFHRHFAKPLSAEQFVNTMQWLGSGIADQKAVEIS
jgi:CheY-like chemotaxis protein